MKALTDIEKARYSRHILLSEIGMEGQLKLKKARVLVIGSGGLGSPVLLYLSAAGVGHIGIIDHDTVDISNLQRQVLFCIDDVGKNKAEVAKTKLHALNPLINIEAYPFTITAENAMPIVKNYDLIIDGSDNFATRYLMNDACVLSGKVNIYASVSRFEGQISVFNYLIDGKRSPNYRDIYPTPPAPGEVLNCAEAGVMGSLTGIIGSMQANEAIKVITGVGNVLASQLFIFDALSMRSHILKYAPNPENPLNGDPPLQQELIDYEIFCGIQDTHDQTKILEISAEELAIWITTKKDFRLIDVREPHEYEIENLGGELFPLSNFEKSVSRIQNDKTIVIHCKSGSRSKSASEILKQKGFKNVYNLKGGIIEYLKKIANKD